MKIFLTVSCCNSSNNYLIMLNRNDIDIKLKNMGWLTSKLEVLSPKLSPLNSKSKTNKTKTKKKKAKTSKQTNKNKETNKQKTNKQKQTKTEQNKKQSNKQPPPQKKIRVQSSEKPYTCWLLRLYKFLSKTTTTATKFFERQT